MGLNAKKVESKGGKRQEPLEAGAYPARLVQVISMGTQTQRPFQGQEKEPMEDIYITYELLDEFVVDDEGNVDESKPRWISERMPFHNLQADRAKSTKRYYALDPKDQFDGDWTKLLGTPVIVTITKKEGKGNNAGKVFNNVAGISSMRSKEAEKAPELKNSSRYFIFDDPDIDVFMALPSWLQDELKKSLDYEGSTLEELVSNYKKPEDDDVKEDNSSDENEDSGDEGEEW